jgi:sulfide:quinone oxidoreductase
VTQIRKLADGLFVSPYVPPQQLASVAREVRTIINNRPDGEEPGQPTSDELKAAAEKLGLHYVHIPVQPGRFSPEQIEQFSDALANGPGPVLAFCKSGMRSTALWALSQAGKADADAILTATANVGFDLQGLKPTIEHLAA